MLIRATGVLLVVFLSASLLCAAPVSIQLTGWSCNTLVCFQTSAGAVFRCTYQDPIGSSPFLNLNGYKATKLTVTRTMGSFYGFDTATVTTTLDTTVTLGAAQTVIGPSCTPTTPAYTFSSETYADGIPSYVYGGTNIVDFHVAGTTVAGTGMTGVLTADTPPAEYYAQLEVDTDPALAYTLEKKVSPGGTAVANLSLGTMFGVKLVKKVTGSGGIRTVVPITSVYSTSSDQINPPFETQDNLFDNSTVVSLSGGASSGTVLKYAAVHLGQLTFTMLPTSIAGVAPIRVTVNIVRPAALGSDFNEFDPYIVAAAHERGIPPQVLKGQAQQESRNGYTLRADGYRYEICTSDLLQISGGQGLINSTPYSLYAMDGALTDASLTSIVDLRNRLWIPDANGNPRHLTHADTGVSAEQIWLGSDWNENWSTNPCRPLSTALSQGMTVAQWVNASLQFIAQTPTASSYGLLQALYSTAVGPPYNWSVPDPNGPGRTQSPRYLVDTPEALALPHGGSLFVGGDEDVNRYWDVYATVPSSFPTQEDFFDSFKVPLRRYTGGGIQDYGINIIDTYQYNWTPTQGIVFP